MTTTDGAIRDFETQNQRLFRKQPSTPTTDADGAIRPTKNDIKKTRTQKSEEKRRKTSEQTKKMQTWVCDREDENVMVIVVGSTLGKELTELCEKKKSQREGWFFYLKLLMSQDIRLYFAKISKYIFLQLLAPTFPTNLSSFHASFSFFLP